MKTIRKSARKILQENVDYINDLLKSFGRVERFELDTLRTYVERQARSNPDFFKWLFKDRTIAPFGENLTGEQKSNYKAWLHDL